MVGSRVVTMDRCSEIEESGLKKASGLAAFRQMTKWVFD